MKTKPILIKIIETLDAFEQSNDDLSFDQFMVYLNQNNIVEKPFTKVLYDHSNVEELLSLKENENRDITVLISFMFKYAKNYLKKALEQSIINTPDEFGFLITMMRNESLTKTALINLLITEKTSGTETIKRLIKKGLLEEFKTSEDKKSVYLKITEKGKTSILEVLPKIEKVTEIVTGNLSENERIVLVHLLNKLDTFHHDIYFDKKMESIDQIYDTKLSQNF